MHSRYLISCAALAAALSPAAQAEEPSMLEDVVVTAPRSEEPLTVRTDPKAPQQPIPAHDGAEYLKTIPGFSAVRKSGTDGEPVLRGMIGSRIGILLDGQQIYGGCGGRMDPPTAYVFPESYDRVTVLKGPEHVTHGPGFSAGTVMFERNVDRFTAPGWKFNGSLTAGSFGRNDQVADIRGGNPDFYVQGAATRTHANDYKDGAGRTIPSFYTRWSEQAAFGLTPNDDTRAEISAIRSNGQAAYADRTMDGSKFARDNVALRFDKKNLTPLFEKVETQVYDNYVDHVMDNYSLRPNTGSKMAMNVDHRVTGGRFATTLRLDELTKLNVGADSKRDLHSYRDSTMGLTTAAAATASYLSKARIEDMRFYQVGVFAELSRYLESGNKLVGGLRVDEHRATDGRYCRGIPDAAGTGCALPIFRMSDTRGMTDKKILKSGFVRYEGTAGGGTWYAGLGHSERFADYWERQGSDPATGKSVFMNVKPEKLTQLDVGTNWNTESWSGSISGFYGKIADYILIKVTNPPPYNVATRNIDATTFGLESSLAYKVSGTWKTSAALAYVRGDNNTDQKPLALQPPLELRLGAEYNDQVYSFGVLWRIVAQQNRYDANSGSIVLSSVDRGRSPGFSVFSLNGGWRPSKAVLVTAGIDNIFNKVYAEHLSQTGAPFVGYSVPNGERIHEPGRNLWLKVNLKLD